MQKYKGGTFRGTAMRALASHQSGLDSSPYIKAISGLNKGWVCLLALSFALFFSPYFSFLLSSKINISKFQVDQETSSKWTCYL